MEHLKCKHCGNCYRWKDAFSKFGFDDGDVKIQTSFIGRALENAGYKVSYFWWRPHNMIIYSIRKGDIEYMPLNTCSPWHRVHRPRRLSSHRDFGITRRSFPYDNTFPLVRKVFN